MFFQLKVMKDSAVPFLAPTPPLSRAAQKIQEQQVSAAPPVSPPVLETVASSTNVNENGNNQEVEGLWFSGMLDLVN